MTRDILAAIGVVSILLAIRVPLRWFWKTRHWKNTPWFWWRP